MTQRIQEIFWLVRSSSLIEKKKKKKKVRGSYAPFFSHFKRAEIQTILKFSYRFSGEFLPANPDEILVDFLVKYMYFFFNGFLQKSR